jgi:hypothetical protein
VLPLLANRSQAPATLRMVPAILPLLAAPSTLLPALAETEPARQALQGLAAETAFLIGVGVASGSIVVETYQRYRARVLEPLVGVVSTGLAGHLVRPVRTWTRRWRRPADTPNWRQRYRARHPPN